MFFHAFSLTLTKIRTMKNLFFLYLLTSSLTGLTQDDPVRRIRVELEPNSFFQRGVSGSLLYTLDKKGLWSVGAYSATLDVPKWTYDRIFTSVDKDLASVRLGFQISASLRYKIKLFCAYESNPYIGLMAGWQYFDVSQQPFLGPVRLSTWLITPNLGYEFYLYNRQLYLNPQLRFVFYAGQDTNTPVRPEAVGKLFVLPQAIIGFKF